MGTLSSDRRSACVKCEIYCRRTVYGQALQKKTGSSCGYMVQWKLWKGIVLIPVFSHSFLKFFFLFLKLTFIEVKLVLSDDSSILLWIKSSLGRGTLISNHQMQWIIKYNAVSLIRPNKKLLWHCLRASMLGGERLELKRYNALADWSLIISYWQLTFIFLTMSLTVNHHHTVS